MGWKVIATYSEEGWWPPRWPFMSPGIFSSASVALVINVDLQTREIELSYQARKDIIWAWCGSWQDSLHPECCVCDCHLRYFSSLREVIFQCRLMHLEPRVFSRLQLPSLASADVLKWWRVKTWKEVIAFHVNHPKEADRLSIHCPVGGGGAH